MDAVTQYYLSQAQGSSSAGPYYVRSYAAQGGRGFGSFLSSIFRWFQPIISSGAKTLGREALKTGTDILSDMASGSGQKPMEIIKDRTKEASKRLQTKLLSGQGIGHMQRRRVVKHQSVARKRKGKALKKKSGKKRKLTVHRDIFS